MKNTKPDLSVIICTEGKRSSLIKTLESISILSISSQVIIVTPVSFEALDSIINDNNLGKIEFEYIEDKGLGIYEAMNLGIERASSRYSIFLNDDDKFLEEAINLGNHIRGQKFFDAYLAPVNLVTLSNHLTSIGKVLDETCVKSGRMPTSHQGQIWSTLFLKNMYGFNTRIYFGWIQFRLRVCADFEFYVRATSNNPQFRILFLPMVESALGGFSDTHPHRRIFESFLILMKYKIHNVPICMLYFLRFEISYFLRRIK